MLGILWLKQLLGMLLVIFINYLYSNTTHEFRYLVQTCDVTWKSTISGFRGGCENN